MKIHFLNEDCTLAKGRYAATNGVSLQLMCEDGSLMAVATICLSGVTLEEGEVIVKDYSENSGMLDALVKAGVVVDTGRRVASGFINAPVCKLLI